MPRKTMRPITLSRVIKICSIALNRGKIDTDIITKELKISYRRAKNLLLELERMKLLCKLNQRYIPNRNTYEFLENIKEKIWRNIHLYFYENYVFYRKFVQILEKHKYDEKGLNSKEIIKEAKSMNLNLNIVAVEVLTDWCIRLSVIQRNLYNGNIYLLNTQVPSCSIFIGILLKCYDRLSLGKRISKIYVEIPKLREEVCEIAKIKRCIFNEMLKKIYQENIGRVELSGAPLISLASRSPLYQKKMIILTSSSNEIYPKFFSEKRREGLKINRKIYYYIAIHDKRLRCPRN